MLKPRIIPCLLVSQGGLVKTRRFKVPTYVGDPLNAVRIFNEKEADEIMVLDIDATSSGVEPDFGLISNIASACRMPFCYGGGIRTVEQAQRIFALGVEKIALSHAAVKDLGLVASIAERVGSQSVAVVLDVKKKGFLSRYGIFTHNGTRDAGICPIEFAKEAQSAGAGEIVINSIDHDGMMEGYDLKLAGLLRSAVTVPMTMIGGAGNLTHLRELITEVGLVGAGAGSLFVFKGKYRAVLINYPSKVEKLDIGL